MEIWLIWIIAGLILMALEFIIPGAIIVFLGMAAIIVGALIYTGLIASILHSFIAWFIISLLLMVVLRSLFVKYFEGNSYVQNVDEDEDSKGKIVEVIEDIEPFKDGRIKYLDTTWNARSDDEIKKGNKAIILARDGSTWIVRSL